LELELPRLLASDTGQCQAFPQDTLAPQSLRGMGTNTLSMLSHGNSTSLKPTQRVSRCLSVRYDGYVQVAPY